MRLRSKLLPLIGLIILFGPACYTATITGTVKGPDGAPFEGAFVQAQNTKTRMAFIVLTDSQGRYRVEKVPAGEYQLTSRATGYRGDPRPGVILTADQDASFDFALQKAPIRWNELSIYQAKQLLPASTGKDTLFAQCFVFHVFPTLMASACRDADVLAIRPRRGARKPCAFEIHGKRNIVRRGYPCRSTRGAVVSPGKSKVRSSG